MLDYVYPVNVIFIIYSILVYTTSSSIYVSELSRVFTK